MNLFVVKDGHGKVIRDGFSKKTDAKAARDELIKQNEATYVVYKATYVVSLGSENHRFKCKKQEQDE